MSDPDQARRIAQLEADNSRLRALLDNQGAPITLRHQVRNALGLMRAILRRSAATKSTVEDFAAHLEGRFDALLRIQTALLLRPDGYADLETLVADELLAQAIQEGERATIDGPPVRLHARQAEVLGLVLHELATNAIKFGAMTVPAGRIAVSWRVDPSLQRLNLIWMETGRAATDALPISRGFGTEAIESMLPYQLGAESTLEFRSDGIRCMIALPLEAPKL